MRRIADHAAGTLLSAAFMLLGPNVQAVGDLSPQESNGRALFLTGQINAPPPYALVGAGDVRVPATAVPCASCHGRDGRGRAERGIIPPDITWPALSARGAGHQRPPYNETSVTRAITMGINAGGNRLDPIMPRFQLTLADAAALLAYLKRLGTLPQPGLDDHKLTFGTVLDEANAAAVEPTLSAYLAEVNRDGGLFGRELELRTEKVATGATRGRALTRLIKSDAIFALLAPLIAGDERAAAAAADADGVPIVGPLTPSVQAAPRSRYVFYLNGGVEAEARALASFSTTWPGSLSIVDDGVPPWHAAAVVAAATVSAASVQRPGDGVLLAAPGLILWLANRAPDRSEIGTYLTLLVPGALAPKVLSNGAAAETWVALANGRPDLAATTRAPLAASNDSTANADPLQRQALAAAKILVEALRRAGRGVTRERLVDTLETLQDFRTGLIPPVSYSPTRRIGSDGVWIVPFAGGEPIWWDR